MAYSIIRLPEVLAQRGRSRSAHYLDIKNGLFPPPVSIGDRAVGWPQQEVDAINAARIAGKGRAQIRELVARIIACRSTAQGWPAADKAEGVGA